MRAIAAILAFAAASAGAQTMSALPDLSKPVYVPTRAMVCTLPNALAARNPGLVGMELATGNCAVLSRALPVRVIRPSTENDLNYARFYGLVRVVISSPDQSDATQTVVWVRISDLQVGR